MMLVCGPQDSEYDVCNSPYDGISDFCCCSCCSSLWSSGLILILKSPSSKQLHYSKQSGRNLIFSPCSPFHRPPLLAPPPLEHRSRLCDKLHHLWHLRRSKPVRITNSARPCEHHRGESVDDGATTVPAMLTHRHETLIGTACIRLASEACSLCFAIHH